MNPERWTRVDALLESVLDLPLTDRDAFLNAHILLAPVVTTGCITG